MDNEIESFVNGLLSSNSLLNVSVSAFIAWKPNLIQFRVKYKECCATLIKNDPLENSTETVLHTVGFSQTHAYKFHTISTLWTE